MGCLTSVLKGKSLTPFPSNPPPSPPFPPTTPSLPPFPPPPLVCQTFTSCGDSCVRAATTWPRPPSCGSRMWRGVRSRASIPSCRCWVLGTHIYQIAHQVGAQNVVATLYIVFTFVSPGPPPGLHRASRTCDVIHAAGFLMLCPVHSESSTKSDFAGLYQIFLHKAREIFTMVLLNPVNNVLDVYSLGQPLCFLDVSHGLQDETR